MNKKEKTAVKKAAVFKEKASDNLRKEHPFETDSQIENRYGNGREKSGSDGEDQDSSGNNH